MLTITLNGKAIQVEPLTFGQVKANADTFNKIAEQGLASIERTEAAAAFLRIAIPELTEEDLDNSAPGALMAASLGIYMATFARPEGPAPA